MRKQRLGVCMALGLVLMAQSVGFGEEGNTTGTFQVESITVTAQKREENPQKVPMGMDVFSQIDLEDAGIGSSVDLARFAPNVHVKNNYTEHVFVIRGISSFSASTYSPATVYVDDVSYPLVHMQDMALFDIERAEILKGPQGTLYGRNSESGVVNIITRRPGPQFQGKVFGSWADDQTLATGFSLGGPVSDDCLYWSGAFQYKSSTGFVENLSNTNDRAADLEHLNGRAQLRWTPGRAWDISWIADVMDKDDHIGGYRFLTGPQATAPFKVRKDTAEYYRSQGSSQVIRATYQGDKINLVSVSSILDYDLDRKADSDIWDSPADQRMSVFRIDQRQYSQELRLSSSRPGGFEWLAGLYGFVEETCFDFDYQMLSKNKAVMHTVTDIDARSLAMFGQGSTTLFHQLRLTAGLRLDYQSMTGHLRDTVRGEDFEKGPGFY